MPSQPLHQSHITKGKETMTISNTDRIGLVYIITDGTYHKIGITKKNVTARLKQMQIGNANELIVVSYQQVRRYDIVEQHLHRKFNSKRYKGEWFKFTSTQEIMALVNELYNISSTDSILATIIDEHQRMLMNRTIKKAPSQVLSKKYKEKRLEKIKEKNRKRLSKYRQYVESQKD